MRSRGPCPSDVRRRSARGRTHRQASPRSLALTDSGRPGWPLRLPDVGRSPRLTVPAAGLAGGLLVLLVGVVAARAETPAVPTSTAEAPPGRATVAASAAARPAVTTGSPETAAAGPVTITIPRAGVQTLRDVLYAGTP